MTSSAREALLDSAGRLFYNEGIAATGVDVVVRAAGVTKPTLYAHFGSKSQLVAAVLQRRHEERRAELEALLDPLPAAEHPLAVMDWLQDFYSERGERGCGFLNAAAELTERDAPARAAVQAEKAWLLDLLVEGCAAAGCRSPELVGSQLLLLIDGVGGRAVVGGRVAAQSAAAEARQAADVLLSACR
jgi:AcrR family transcriptional regulator